MFFLTSLVNTNTLHYCIDVHTHTRTHIHKHRMTISIGMPTGRRGKQMADESQYIHSFEGQFEAYSIENRILNVVHVRLSHMNAFAVFQHISIRSISVGRTLVFSLCLTATHIALFSPNVVLLLLLLLLLSSDVHSFLVVSCLLTYSSCGAPPPLFVCSNVCFLFFLRFGSIFLSISLPYFVSF